MKTIKLLITAIFMSATCGLYAQVAISTENSDPDDSAMLDVISTEKGILIPRMTKDQRDDISDPAEGLMVYQTNFDKGFYYYDGDLEEWIYLLPFDGDYESLDNLPDLNIEDWNDAHGWGDHSAEAYATKNMNNENITNLADPTDAQDAATKAYVDLLEDRITALENKMILMEGLTDVDGNEYEIVIIGEQVWMAENLRVTRYADGTSIPTGLDNTSWENTTDGAYAIYPHSQIDGLNSDEEVVEAYGKLYNWYAVDDASGLCPAGWRVPTYDDWTELVDYVVEQGYPNNNEANGAGNALKSCRQVDHDDKECETSEHPRWDSDGTHSGFDEFGFSGLPGGYKRSSDGESLKVGEIGNWWSSNGPDTYSSEAFYMSLYNIYGFTIIDHNYMNSGYSVRCIRDND